MKTLRILLAGLMLAAAPAMAGTAFAPAFLTSDLTTAQSAIILAGARAKDVSRLRQVPSVGVVNLNIRRTPFMRDSSLPEAYEFRGSARHNAAGIRKLRAALSANPVTRKALASRGIPINRIVGVRISSNGSLRVYIL